MNYKPVYQVCNVHGGGFLHVVGSGMQQGIEGKGGTLAQIIGIGAPGNGLRIYIIYYKGLPLAGIQTDGNLGVRFTEGLAQGIGSIFSILLLHQTYKVLGQLHPYTLTTPLMAGHGS